MTASEKIGMATKNTKRHKKEKEKPEGWGEETAFFVHFFL
jgi:hypothetical protein